MSRLGENRRMIVGLIGVVVSVLFVYFVFTKQLPFSSGYRVEAVFDSSNQLKKGDPVRVAGVDVGEVAEMDKGEGQTAKVTLELSDSGRPVHSDATLKIRSRLFLEGGFYVEMEPGSPSAPELDDGATIPLGQTAIPVQFHQVLTALDRPARESLQSMLTELDTALGGGGAEALGRSSKPLAPTLRDVAILAEAARGREPGDVSDTVVATSKVTAALAQRENELGQLVTNLNRTTAALARNDTALAAGVRELDATLGQAPDALRAIDRALPPTEAFAADLRPSLDIAPRTLSATPPMLRQVEAISRRPELPRALDLLEPTINRLPQLERRLGRLLPTVTPVTDCVGKRAVPTLKSAVPDGALTTGLPVYQELLHLVVGLASAGQGFDANGHAVRYNLGAGLQTVSLGTGPGALLGRAEQAISGSRPLWLGPGRRPPYRPDQRCIDQAMPDLSARGGGGTAVTQAATARAARPKLDRGDLKGLVTRATRALKRGSR